MILFGKFVRCAPRRGCRGRKVLFFADILRCVVLHRSNQGPAPILAVPHFGWRSLGFAEFSSFITSISKIKLSYMTALVELQENMLRRNKKYAGNRLRCGKVTESLFS
jgi:hypothetical protein